MEIEDPNIPCKCQTKMSVWLDIVLVVQIKWDCAKPQLASLATVKQDQWLDHFQQTDHIRLYPHLRHHIFPWGSCMLLQCLHMYYTQWAVQWKNKLYIKIWLGGRLHLLRKLLIKQPTWKNRTYLPCRSPITRIIIPAVTYKAVKNHFHKKKKLSQLLFSVGN